MEGSGGNGGRKSFAASLEIDVPHGDQLQRLEVAVEDESNQSSDDRSRSEPQLPPFSPPSPLPPPPSPSSASPFLHRPTSPTAPSFSSSRKSSMSQVRASLEVTIEGGDTRILSKRIATPRKLTAPRGAPTLPYMCLLILIIHPRCCAMTFNFPLFSLFVSTSSTPAAGDSVNYRDEILREVPPVCVLGSIDVLRSCTHTAFRASDCEHRASLRRRTRDPHQRTFSPLSPAHLDR